MELLVDRSQILAIHVGVDLRSRKVGVAQHLLHCPKIRAALEQMGREAVAEGVWRDSLADTGPLTGSLHHAPGAHS
jgi:deoxyinosine 3'endonuclease (endonuclease V)